MPLGQNELHKLALKFDFIEWWKFSHFYIK